MVSILVSAVPKPARLLYQQFYPPFRAPVTLWRHRHPRTRFISSHPREIPLPRRLKTFKSFRFLLQIPILLQKSICFPIPSQRNCRASLERWMKMKSWNVLSRPRLSHRLSLSQIGMPSRSNQVSPWEPRHIPAKTSPTATSQADMIHVALRVTRLLLYCRSMIDFSSWFLSKGSNSRFYR